MRVNILILAIFLGLLNSAYAQDKLPLDVDGFFDVWRNDNSTLQKIEKNIKKIFPKLNIQSATNRYPLKGQDPQYWSMVGAFKGDSIAGSLVCAQYGEVTRTALKSPNRVSLPFGMEFLVPLKGDDAMWPKTAKTRLSCQLLILPRQYQWSSADALKPDRKFIFEQLDVKKSLAKYFSTLKEFEEKTTYYLYKYIASKGRKDNAVQLESLEFTQGYFNLVISLRVYND